MSIAIAIFNQKGGAGKTPVTINLAGALSALGKSVLVCDLDGQVALITSVGFVYWSHNTGHGNPESQGGC